MQRSAAYTILFATVVCIVCAIFVSYSAVSLRDLQSANAELDKRRNVLIAAGLAAEGERLAREEIESRFEKIDPVVVDLATGSELPEVDPAGFDEQRLALDPSTSRSAPPNPAQVQRIPHRALVYRVRGEGGELEMLVFPVEGKGLWSTLYGFIALDADLNTVRGITFYRHGETPGLGGEVDNPRWKALWRGRRIFDASGRPRIEVVKGRAGPPEEAPFAVDGLSGATMTSRGVTYLLRFWLGENGFGPYLEKLKNRSKLDGKQTEPGVMGPPVQQ